MSDSINILIISRDPSMNSMYPRILARGEGLPRDNITIVQNGAEARQQIQHNEFDCLIVSNFSFGDMNANEIATIYKMATRRGYAIGVTGGEVAAFSLKLFQHVLPKPFGHIAMLIKHVELARDGAHPNLRLQTA